ncbi:hypothetical protein WS90_25380 [Burkholderia cepacia]|uniref:Disulfide bond formation protein B n=1 Tax=Burkholderia cepacia TaxID=292 RepID=A0A103Z9V4_BURCE|nr:disulfide bond formation protein B [Burkholderia cepacia]KVK75973.1 hypothetical protein WS90_25380 [Burkholderia cepacia]
MKLDTRHLEGFDIAGLLGVSITLLAAFYFQLALRELPCAFCNLIRVGFMIFGSGLLLNLRFGAQTWNYLLSAFGALIGSLISLLFMFAKAPSYTTPTGSAIFGLHMYTWTYVIFTCAIMYCVLMPCLHAQARAAVSTDAQHQPCRPAVGSIAIALFITLVAANLVSAFLQNGFHPFKAGGQKHYEMLYDGDVMKP